MGPPLGRRRCVCVHVLRSKVLFHIHPDRPGERHSFTGGVQKVRHQPAQPDFEQRTPSSHTVRLGVEGQTPASAVPTHSCRLRFATLQGCEFQVVNPDTDAPRSETDFHAGSIAPRGT